MFGSRKPKGVYRDRNGKSDTRFDSTGARVKMNLCGVSFSCARCRTRHSKNITLRGIVGQTASQTVSVRCSCGDHLSYNASTTIA